MVWTVVLEDAFDEEFKELSKEVQDELLASAKLLEEYGPQLKRPHSDTLNDSDYKNMKELRFDADDGCGVLPTHLIQAGRASFSSQETSPG